MYHYPSTEICRNKRKYACLNESSATCMAMEDVQLVNGLECRIACNSYKVFWSYIYPDICYIFSFALSVLTIHILASVPHCWIVARDLYIRASKNLSILLFSLAVKTVIFHLFGVINRNKTSDFSPWFIHACLSFFAMVLIHLIFVFSGRSHMFWTQKISSIGRKEEVHHEPDLHIKIRQEQKSFTDFWLPHKFRYPRPWTVTLR